MPKRYLAAAGLAVVVLAGCGLASGTPAPEATSQGQGLPSWMVTCMSAGGITAVSPGQLPELSSSAIVATARTYSAMLASATAVPVYMKYVLATTSDTQMSSVLASPLWAAGFTDLPKVVLPGGLYPAGSPPAPRYLSGRIVFLTDPGDTTVLALDCSS